MKEIITIIGSDFSAEQVALLMKVADNAGISVIVSHNAAEPLPIKIELPLMPELKTHEFAYDKHVRPGYVHPREAFKKGKQSLVKETA